MPRKPRTSAPGVTEHVIQRGNNRQAVFRSDRDMAAYANWLSEYARKYNVAIHAWVFMTNHVHLLCTPSTSTAISQMMQSLGRMYVMYFNKAYERTGTLWEGRYRSCLVEDERYLFELHRYIELNPVRAGMVDDPAEYSWSSYQCNGLGKQSSLLTRHRLYTQMGSTDSERQQAYRELFHSHVEGELLDEIRKSSNKGLVLGSESFIDEIEKLTGSKLKEGRRGRRVGWRKSEN